MDHWLSVFAGNQRNSPIWRELVFHFLEWSTGSFVFAGNQGYSTFWRELVVHSPEWSTGSSDFAGNQAKATFWRELVPTFSSGPLAPYKKASKTGLLASYKA